MGRPDWANHLGLALTETFRHGEWIQELFTPAAPPLARGSGVRTWLTTRPAGQAATAATAPAGRSLKPTPEFQQKLDDFRAHKEAKRTPGRWRIAGEKAENQEKNAAHRDSGRSRAIRIVPTGRSAELNHDSRPPDGADGAAPQRNQDRPDPGRSGRAIPASGPPMALMVRRRSAARRCRAGRKARPQRVARPAADAGVSAEAG